SSPASGTPTDCPNRPPRNTPNSPAATATTATTEQPEPRKGRRPPGRRPFCCAPENQRGVGSTVTCGGSLPGGRLGCSGHAPGSQCERMIRPVGSGVAVGVGVAVAASCGAGEGPPTLLGVAVGCGL